MDSAQERKPGTMLKYTKRRYDGGSELELIRFIERQQTAAQLDRLHKKQQELEVNQHAIGGRPEPQPAVSPAKPAEVRQRRLLETLMLGPLQICVGAVGVLTALLAMATSARFNNPDLLAQSRVVLKDCSETLKKGILDTLKAPARAVQSAF